MTILFEPNRQWCAHLDSLLGTGVHTADRIEELQRLLASLPADPLVVFGPNTDARVALDFAARERLTRPALGVLLLREHIDVETMAQAMRAGIRDVVDAHDANAIQTACGRSLEVSRQLLGTVTPTQQTTEARVVTVFSAKGGCGKSTLATNLAVSLADGGRRRVCLVDLDLAFGDVGIMLQLSPDRGIADAANSRDRIDSTLVRALLTSYAPGVEVLLAPVGPTEAERIGRDLVVQVLRRAPRDGRLRRHRHAGPLHRGGPRRARRHRRARAGGDTGHPGAEEPAHRHGHARPARAEQGQPARRAQPQRRQASA